MSNDQTVSDGTSGLGVTLREVAVPDPAPVSRVARKTTVIPYTDSRPSTYPIKFPQYKEYEARVQSFQGWPTQAVGQQPPVLAHCGFFYIGSADRARCFSCGTTLRNWEEGDDPYEEHQKWATNCQFIRSIDPPCDLSDVGQSALTVRGQAPAVGRQAASQVSSPGRQAIQPVPASISPTFVNPQNGTFGLEVADSYQPLLATSGLCTVTSVPETECIEMDGAPAQPTETRTQACPTDSSSGSPSSIAASPQSLPVITNLPPDLNAIMNSPKVMAVIYMYTDLPHLPREAVEAVVLAVLSSGREYPNAAELYKAVEAHMSGA